MLGEIIVSIFLGIFAGTFTGLIPGIHINLVGATLVSFSFSLLSKINPLFLMVFIVAMAITHTFLDFIPSIFLGCPDTDTELSILPGHELLKNGQGHVAILLANYGSIIAIFVILLISYPSIYLIEKFYTAISPLIPLILILTSIILILLQKNKLTAFFVFALTGILGLITLNLNSQQILLPLLTGLFGASSIIISLKNKTTIPKQIITKTPFEFKPILGAIIAAPICSFLPGLGSGQAAIIGNTISRTDKKGFLSLLGATNTLVMGFSFIALYAIGKTRTGAALAIKDIIGQIDSSKLILILLVILTAGIISYFLTIKISKVISTNIHKISYKKISIGTIILLLIVNFLVAGPIGLFILTVSTLTGIYCINLGVKRTNMMGCLLIPTIFLYLL